MKSPETVLRIWNDKYRIIAERKLPELHPEVALWFRITLPAEDRSYTLDVVVDPERKVYEKVRLNNRIKIGVKVLAGDEWARLDRREKDKFEEKVKRANAEYCLSRIELTGLVRTDKTMGYERAEDGEEVEFEAEIENECGRVVYDLTLQWYMREISNFGGDEMVFGVVRLDSLNAGEKMIMRRSCVARSGKWRIGLKLILGHSRGEKERYPNPTFLLIAE